jgi:4-alpha-glucanotransferase
LREGERPELAALQHLAHQYHVQTSYTDLAGAEVQAGPDSLLAALIGLGAPIARVADAEVALRQCEQEEWQWRLQPVLVAWAGALDEVELRLPAAEAHGAVELQLALENGLAQRWHFDAADAVSDRQCVGESDYVALRFTPNQQLPYGYHRLVLRLRGRKLESLVIAAPRRAYSAGAGKRWGVFLPLYALHSRRSWGIGDFTDLGALVDWASGQGARFVATLPLLASFLETPYEPSPYVPVSRLFWNEIYIDPEVAATALGGRLAQDHGVPVATVGDAHRLNAREPVPFREVMGLKRRVLEQLTRLSNQGPANEVGREPRAPRPAFHDYAAFRAAVERLGPSWRVWPEQQRSGALSAADYDGDCAAYYTFAQSEAGRQIASLASKARKHGVRLYLDLPVGVHPDGYDAWRYQELFIPRMSVGAPPDLLARDGQDWGFAPLNPEALRACGYEYMRAYLQHHLSAAGILRIDHAIGLHRLFWIPQGASAREGVFMRQPAEELYAILALESQRAEAVLVGENLGLVPPEVDAGLAEHGVAGMSVQLFEMTRDPQRPLEPPRRESVASFGTHDLPTFAAYWMDTDLALACRMGVMTEETAGHVAGERTGERQALAQHLRDRGLIGEDATVAAAYRGATRLLAESEAEWALVNLEDTWGETRSQNVPGTMAHQHPNWTGRARYGLEQIEASKDVASVTEMMRDLRPYEEQETLDGG